MTIAVCFIPSPPPSSLFLPPGHPDTHHLPPSLRLALWRRREVCGVLGLTPPKKELFAHSRLPWSCACVEESWLGRRGGGGGGGGWGWGGGAGGIVATGWNAGGLLAVMSNHTFLMTTMIIIMHNSLISRNINRLYNHHGDTIIIIHNYRCSKHYYKQFLKTIFLAMHNFIMYNNTNRSLYSTVYTLLST